MIRVGGMPLVPCLLQTSHRQQVIAFLLPQRERKKEGGYFSNGTVCIEAFQ